MSTKEAVARFLVLGTDITTKVLMTSHDVPRKKGIAFQCTEEQSVHRFPRKTRPRTSSMFAKLLGLRVPKFPARLELVTRGAKVVNVKLVCEIHNA